MDSNGKKMSKQRRIWRTSCIDAIVYFALKPQGSMLAKRSNDFVEAMVSNSPDLILQSVNGIWGVEIPPIAGFFVKKLLNSLHIIF